MPTLSGLRLAIRVRQSIDGLAKALVAALPELPNFNPRRGGWDAGRRAGASPHARGRGLDGASHFWFKTGEDPLGPEVPIFRDDGDIADDLS